MIRALWWKEWREQRWRLALAALVLVTISAGLVRAQLVTTDEATLLTFGPLGLLLTIFLAMGSVATERADGTWPFLMAQPLGRATVLRTKWAVGAVHLVAAFLLAGCAAHWAAWSRDLFRLQAVPIEYALQMGVTAVPGGNSPGWLWSTTCLATISMLAWYTVLFFLLTRARNELHAGLGGMLLTLAVLIWLAQYGMAQVPLGATGFSAGVWRLFWFTGIVCPLSPLASFVQPWFVKVIACALAAGLWIGAPLWLVGRLKSPRRWR